MKKFFLRGVFFALFFLNSIFSLSAFTGSDIKVFAFQNGLELYFLEDSSSPVIRLELNINAGLSSQTPKNAGYFPLYANIRGIELSEDRVKTVRTVSPEKVEHAVLELSDFFKPLRISDTELKAVLDQTKTELTEYYSQPQGFINSAIDSKLFPSEPWKRSSGAIPSLFNSKTIAESRSILSDIAKFYYTPDRARLFVSGNITENAVLELCNKYFLQFEPSPAAKNSKQAEADAKADSSRKFVLHHKDFSPEMTQICLQYKNLDQKEAEILSAVWGDDSSVFKKNLTKQKNLEILGSEYIDASSAQDSMASRLIIQSLLGAVKVSPVVQADLFISKSRENQTVTDEMISKSLKKSEKALGKLYENSALLMENLADFLLQTQEEDKIYAFFNQTEKLYEISAESILKKVSEESPFVFIFVNTDIYNKNAAAFKKAGYKVLTEKNSVWYRQSEYEAILNTKEEKAAEDSTLQEDIMSSAGRFIAKSKSEITTLALENEIPVVLKQNANTTDAEISLIIAGGDLLFAEETPGLCSILTGSIAVNIRNQLKLFAENGAMETEAYSVKAKTLSTHSMINVTLPAKYLNFAIQAMYSALIFCDVTPATADGVTYDERTQWRLKSGTGEFQLLCEAMRILYEGTKYPRLFEDNADKPQDMNFTKILASYPALLDATRFSFVVTGGFSDQGKLLLYMNKTFGTLETHAETRFFETGLPKPVLSSSSPKEKTLQLRHLFLTDIPKEKAGPMPAVLIPTKIFLDPVLFCLNTPDETEADSALFNALLLELGKKMNARARECGNQSFVKIYLPEFDIPFARIAITNIEHKDKAKKIFSEAVNELKDEIKAQIELKNHQVIDLEKNELLARLENNWIMEVISGAGTNENSAELVKMSFLKGNPRLYLEQYEAVDKAQLEDYFLIAESWLSEVPPLEIHSKDSKK